MGEYHLVLLQVRINSYLHTTNDDRICGIGPVVWWIESRCIFKDLVHDQCSYTAQDRINFVLDVVVPGSLQEFIQTLAHDLEVLWVKTMPVSMW